MDVLVSTEAGNLKWFRNNNDDTFQPMPRIAVGTSKLSIAADLDGDGDVDVLSLRSKDGALRNDISL